MRKFATALATVTLAATGLGVATQSATAGPTHLYCTYEMGGTGGVRIWTEPGSGTVIGYARAGVRTTVVDPVGRNGYTRGPWMDNAGNRHPGTWVSSSYLRLIGCVER